jgi:hypothetical protein
MFGDLSVCRGYHDRPSSCSPRSIFHGQSLVPHELKDAQLGQALEYQLYS